MVRRPVAPGSDVKRLRAARSIVAAATVSSSRSRTSAGSSIWTHSAPAAARSSEQTVVERYQSVHPSQQRIGGADASWTATEDRSDDHRRSDPQCTSLVHPAEHLVRVQGERGLRRDSARGSGNWVSNHLVILERDEEPGAAGGEVPIELHLRPPRLAVAARPEEGRSVEHLVVVRKGVHRNGTEPGCECVPIVLAKIRDRFEGLRRRSFRPTRFRQFFSVLGWVRCEPNRARWR